METCPGKPLPIASEFRICFLGIDKVHQFGRDSLLHLVLTHNRIFEGITRDKTLIIGRKTLLEGGSTGNFNHVEHCRQVIVVSRTLKEQDLKRLTMNESDTSSSSRTLPRFHVASSVVKAIRLAQQNDGSDDIVEGGTSSSSPCSFSSSLDLSCWIGGGEEVYRKALELPQAQFLHLTLLNVHVPVSVETAHVAYFPQHWETNYRLVKQAEYPASDPISFVTRIFRRKDCKR